MKKGLLILGFILFPFLMFAQKELSPSDWKMTQAKMFFEDDQMGAALEIYLELFEEYASDEFLNLRIAECYFAQYDYEKAKEHLESIMNSNPESKYIDNVNFWYAKTIHQMGNFEEAILYYNKVADGIELYDSTIVKNLISQSYSAMKMRGIKQDYKCVNLGLNINSEFNEIFPIYAWNEDKIYVTTDRLVNEGQDANPSTGLYDFSVLESFYENEEFGELCLVDEVFSNAKDYILTSVGAGAGEYVLFKNSPEFEDNGDIYYLKLKDELDISQPQNIGETVNSLKFDGAGSLDFINHELYFSTNSNNKKGEEKDIFYSNQRNINFSNSLVVSDFKSEFDESFVYLHPGGDFVVFSSNCGKSVGGYDLFISVKKDKKWTEPQNMGFAFNSVENEMHFTLSPDGEFAYITSDRPEGYGLLDVYQIEFKKYFEENFGYKPELTIIQGQISDENGKDVAAKISVSNNLKDCYNQKVDTDAEGYFTIVVKPGTKYKLEVKQSSYEKYSMILDLSDSSKSTINLDVELEIKE